MATWQSVVEYGLTLPEVDEFTWEGSQAWRMVQTREPI